MNMSKQRLSCLFIESKPFLRVNNYQIKRQVSQAVKPEERVISYPRFTIEPEQHGHWVTCRDLKKYKDIETGQKADDLITMTGRIVSKRESSSKLTFYDLVQNGESIQVVASRGRYKGTREQFEFENRQVSRGDIASFTGVPGKTNKGQLSVFVTNEIKVLTPCLRDIPRTGLKDPEKRFRNRHLDLLVNPESQNILRTRSKVIQFVRQFLDKREFVEVETPVLSSKAGGANARPFATHAHALDMDMQLRIAPELYLKQLVIGGMDRVYEIGKQFRNEGIDADHNPEFTTCEFYQAYGNLESLMNDTELMLSEMATRICGDKPIKSKSGETIDFHSAFKRVNVTERLASILNTSLDFLDDKDAEKKLYELCLERNIKLSGPPTSARLLDALISEYIEPECTQPTFLYNHPLALSPLAKDMIDKNGLAVAARFELFVGGKEIVNAYEELNDPKEQRRRFELQIKDREQGDLEAPIPDDDFCEALEYGLPPTAGWGMGIDRVVQLMTGATHIREVLAFPTMRPIVKKQDE
ncbi:lysyl-tRNA synthetase [Backusella circina FSU 941]|nr:lysyl-tRNA synthetase [Backusella circina FSU 941]